MDLGPFPFMEFGERSGIAVELWGWICMGIVYMCRYVDVYAHVSYMIYLGKLAGRHISTK